MCSNQAEIITLWVQRLCPRRGIAADVMTPRFHHLLLGLGHRSRIYMWPGRDRGRGMDRMTSLGLNTLELVRQILVEKGVDVI